MYEGSHAKVQMQRTILEDGYFNDASYDCNIITYNPNEERIYLISESAELPLFSLDGIYDCMIESEGCMCSGVIIERYWNSQGRIIVFKIKNGFYKKVLN